MSRILRFFPVLLLACLVGCAHDDPSKKLTNMPPGTGFSVRTSSGAAGSHKYSLFIPRGYAAGMKMPTIVFLHGIGESGSDGIGCTTVGIGPAIAKRNGEFPFIVIFPQTGMSWTSEQSEKIMLDAVNDARKFCPGIDPERISLTGMSSGGEGTWVLGARHPELFAALVPMGGFAAEKEVPRLTKIPIWVLHNDGDFIVGVGNSRKMNELITAKGGKIKYTEYKSGGHNCWDQAYDEGELFKWLQEQRLAMR